jgi:hypothetical protein
LPVEEAAPRADAEILLRVAADAAKASDPPNRSPAAAPSMRFTVLRPSDAVFTVVPTPWP